MPRLQSHNELTVLRERQVELAKRIAKAEAAERGRAKRDQLRREQIAGAAALEHMAAQPQSAFAAKLLSLISERARSVGDRSLFSLPPNKPQNALPAPANGGNHDTQAD